mgnify:CR=1 FL=1
MVSSNQVEAPPGVTDEIEEENAETEQFVVQEEDLSLEKQKVTVPQEREQAIVSAAEEGNNAIEAAFSGGVSDVALFGLLGTQIIAPNSIMAWLCVAGSDMLISPWERFLNSSTPLGELMAVEMSYSLLKTRNTFPSTTAVG